MVGLLVLGLAAGKVARRDLVGGSGPSDAVTLPGALSYCPTLGEAPCTDVCRIDTPGKPAGDCYATALPLGAALAACGCEVEAWDAPSAAAGKPGLCDQYLYVAYKSAAPAMSVDDAEGLWRLGPGAWGGRKLAAKKSVEQDSLFHDVLCTRTYTAVCEESAIEVVKECVERWGGATTTDVACGGKWTDGKCVEARALERSLANLFSKSYGTDVQHDKGEYAVDVYDPDWRKRKLFGTGSVDSRGRPTTGMVGTEFATLTKDTRVSWEVAAGAIALKKIPRKQGLNHGQGWQVDSGCYCCKHEHSVIGSPFETDRQAWTRTDTHYGPDAETVEKDGTQECMLAWADLSRDTELPGILVMMLDRLTLTAGSHAACRYTCGHSLAGGSSLSHPHSYRKL